MDFQKLFDAMAASERGCRARYHLTLGALIKALESCAADLPVRTSDGSGVGRPDSYRGYYADLAFRAGDMKAGELLAAAREAVGTEFTGYKGGDFLMGEDTPLWFAEYGNCGPAIIDVQHQGDVLVLKTKDV